MIKRKVVYFHHYPSIGGSSISLSLLLKYLDRQKYDPMIVLTHEGACRELFEALNLHVEYLPVYSVHDKPWYSMDWFVGKDWLAFQDHHNVFQWLKKNRPDIIHLNDTPLLAVGKAASKLNIPIVWHIRHVYNKYFFDPQRTMVLRSIEKYATRIIPISEDESSQFKDLEKISIIYNSIDFDVINSFLRSGEILRNELNISSHDCVVLSIIPLSISKGALDFVEACGLALKTASHINFKFVIVGALPSQLRRNKLRKITGLVGDVYLPNKIEEISRKYQIDDKLILTGFRNDIYRFIDMADLVVFPSHLHATGRPVIEGSAMGKPVIVTIPQKITQVVMDGITGLILPPKSPKELAKAIVRLAIDKEAAIRMGQAGRSYALDKFDAKQNISSIHKIYNEILTSKLN